MQMSLKHRLSRWLYRAVLSLLTCVPLANAAEDTRPATGLVERLEQDEAHQDAPVLARDAQVLDAGLGEGRRQCGRRRCG